MRLLLDAGGVIVDQRTVESLLAGFGLTRTSSVWRGELRRPLWRGEMSLMQAAELLLRRYGSGDERRLHEYTLPGLLPWAHEAVSLGMRTAILSNHRHEWLLPALAPLRDNLDAVFVSSLIGECKPDDAAFLKVCALWHCEPREVVFVDDQNENLETASRLGMRVVRANPESRTWIDTVRHIGGRL